MRERERERERDRESTPFPFWIFPLLFPSTKQNLFFFLFFFVSLFQYAKPTPRSTRERSFFPSLLSFPFLSFPLLSFPFYFVCVCVNMNAKAVFLDHVFMLSFIPKSPSDFCPFVSLSIPAEYGANWWRSCIVFWSRTQSPRVKTQHP